MYGISDHLAEYVISAKCEYRRIIIKFLVDANRIEVQNVFNEIIKIDVTRISIRFVWQL